MIDEREVSRIAYQTILNNTAVRLDGTATWDPANLLTLTQATTTVTVTGAALGDTVLMSFSLSLSGLTLTGYVSAADTVTAVLFNGTVGAVDLGSGTLRAEVWKATA